MPCRLRKQEHSSVGCIKIKDMRGLNGTAYGDLVHQKQAVKACQEMGFPLLTEISSHAPFQRSEPMSLAAPGKIGAPALIHKALFKTCVNGGYGILEAAPIPLRTQTENSATGRAAVSAQPHTLIIAVKVGQDITMAPEFMTFTTRTYFWPGPIIRTAFKYNFLDGNGYF